MSSRPSSPSRLYEPNEPIPGTVYRVLKLLAQGGMGNVYDVEDVTVGKRYVLKTLTPDLVGRTDLTRRMDAEARVLARLAHPNIVEVITAGTTADSLSLPFLVMERLYGQSLRTVLDKRGAVEFPYACKVAIDLLDALEHAHEHGVIHRDVKPENIFLHRTPFGVTVTKLLDFGVMRLSDARVRETQGRFVGTLRYAAPEQLTAQEITPAVDIYAAGLVLYEMLCGVGPFDDEETSAKIAKAHVTREAPRASTRIALPADIDDLLARALSKNPAHRPPDAFSFAAELRKRAAPPRASEAPPSSAQTNAHPMPALSTAAPMTASPNAHVPPIAEGAADIATARRENVAAAARVGPEAALPTEFLTEVAAAEAPLPRAATVAASAAPEAKPALVIDRGAPTRSIVAATEDDVPDNAGGAAASLRRTAPLVVSTPPAHDFQFPKETGVTPSTEPSAVSAQSAQTSAGGRRGRGLFFVASGVLTAALVTGGLFLLPRMRIAVTKAPADRATANDALPVIPSAHPTASSLPAPPTFASSSLAPSLAPSATAPSSAPSDKNTGVRDGATVVSKGPSRATGGRPASSQGAPTSPPAPPGKLPGIDF